MNYCALIFSIILLLLAIIFGCNNANNKNDSIKNKWFRHIDLNGNYISYFPEPPNHFDTIIDIYSSGNAYKYTTVYKPEQKDPNHLYQVSFEKISSLAINKFEQNKYAFIDSSIKSIKNNLDAQLIESKKISESNSCYIKRIKMLSKPINAIINTKLYLCDTILYTASVISPAKNQDNTNIDLFLNSFEPFNNSEK
ncbi:MAG: hypothetical protein WD048_11055 [Chitinophagales bacterium]